MSIHKEGMTMQESGATSRQRSGSHKMIKAGILLAIVVAGSLLLTVAALAQQSSSYDLACWSVTTGGGGLRSSASFRLQDAVGQNAGGAGASSNFQMRTGIVQDLAFAAPSPTPVPTHVPPPSGTLTINLPLISSYVIIQRTCPQ
jgi:hypothetical protein